MFTTQREGSMYGSLIRSLRYKKINREHLLRKVHLYVEKIDYHQATKYAAAILEDPSADNTQFRPLPPFFPAIYIYANLKQIISDPRLQVNLVRMVHSDLGVKWMRPITYDASLNIKTWASEVIDIPAGELLRIENEIWSGSHLVARIDLGLLIRNSDSRTRSAKHNDISYQRPLYQQTIVTRAEQPMEYARASGDYNFIHTNRFLARLVGLPGAVLHGTCLMSMVYKRINSIIVGEGYKDLKEIYGRFSHPVQAGESLRLDIYPGGCDEELFFNLFNKNERTVIRHGRFTVGK